MDTVNKLSEYFMNQNVDIKVIGIPKTIDNDLCVTDHIIIRQKMLDTEERIFTEWF